MTTASMLDKFTALSERLDAHELDNYKLLLGIAAGGLAPHGHMPTPGSEKDRAFDLVLRCLAKIQPTGVLWRGRPDFMDDQLLGGLQREAELGRSHAITHDRYFLGCGGPIADRLAKSRELTELVDSFAEDMEATGIASYLWYDAPGCGLSPHIDTEVFTLNVILMLSHQYPPGEPSHLVLYPVGEKAERVLLRPGEILLLYAGGTVHAREDVQPGEAVSLLTFGFRPRPR
jgi:hypothetical protein